MIAGLSRPGVAAGIEEMARSGALVNRLRRARPRTGELWFCPAGALHALGPGLILLEIQQNSDVTFRLYDWGRVGLDGKPRQLHLDESIRAAGDGAKRVTRCASRPLRGLGFPARRRVACEAFVIDDWRIARAVRREKPRAFEALHVAEGAGALRHDAGAEVRLRKGMTVLVPAAVDAYDIVPARALRIIRSAEGE
jgi:mannose-6-phosphate isomerase